MRNLRLHAIVACIAPLALWSCGKEESAPAAVKKVVEEKVPAYTYPAPVKGHYKEINIGEFDVVDGIAYPARRETQVGRERIYTLAPPLLPTGAAA